MLGTGKDISYNEVYASMTEEQREIMSGLFDTGMNSSGVWVRYKDVENVVAALLVLERRKNERPISR